MFYMTAGSLAFIVLVLVVAKVTRHFASPQRLPVTAEWIDELSIERYRPMLRLLKQEDLRFLRRQPSFTPEMATKFRLKRCQVVQAYLCHLDADFKRICTALKIFMVQSRHDRPDLATRMLRSQMTFAYRMMVVQFQLVFYRFGVGTVGVTGLLKLFDGMRTELRTRMPVELAAGG